VPLISGIIRLDLMALTYDATINSIGNIRAWWRLDEASGTSAADDGPNSYTGTHVSSTGTGDVDVIVNRSTYSKVYDDPTGNTSTDVGTQIATDVGGNTAMSISAWMKFDSIASSSNTGRVAVRSDAQFRLYNFYDSGSENGVYFLLNGLTSTLANSPKIDTSDITTGVWYHIMGTWSSATGDAKIYLDSVLKDTKTSITGSLAVSANTTRIGSDSSGAAYRHRGHLQEIVVFDSEVSQADVENIYNSGTA